MSNVRWNFNLGPIRINSPFGAISWGVVGALLLMCCCGGVIGSFGDDSDQPTRPVVDSSALSTSASAVPSRAAPSPSKSTVVKSSPTPKRTTARPKPSPTRKPAPKNDPQFDTCGEANANGYGPYVEGEDPEYDWYQDRDGDGLVCEPA